jgi:hypothetical protein
MILDLLSLQAASPRSRPRTEPVAAGRSRSAAAARGHRGAGLQQRFHPLRTNIQPAADPRPSWASRRADRRNREQAGTRIPPDEPGHPASRFGGQVRIPQRPPGHRSGAVGRFRTCRRPQVAVRRVVADRRAGLGGRRTRAPALAGELRLRDGVPDLLRRRPMTIWYTCIVLTGSRWSSRFSKLP